MSLLVVGSVAYDGIETPFGKKDRILGGSATYISLAASYFANQINLVGVVGKDFADEDIELLKSKDIDLEGLQIDKSGNTFFWQGKYHYDLNNRDTLDTQLNVFEHFDPIIPDGYKDSKYVALGNIEPSLQEKVLDQVNNPDLVVMDTMNFWIEGTPDALKKTLKGVDLLVINDSEARELAEEPNLIKAADKVREMGPDSLIIKKGEHGALLFAGDEIFSAPAYPVIDIFDPTGAGDTFMGGLLGWLSYTDDLTPNNMRKAVIFGSVMASFCVEKFGPERLKDLTEKEIYDRYREFRQLSEIPEID
ncbi:PfkB family carbohydrate kinase [Rhodohalobacter sp.]|uniref:PfkB family carbohydrate kinase n=1 Tax=Rhodohalobacter sp. TaxID=1974210 RepID=UPI002ACD283B|nr:PfkB family carbohydrate kinase [Rhodohalobacter sp.]MDZ7755588.1 PfkB family carbohydrate kinase [Rhodohalobacter sp.]